MRDDDLIEKETHFVYSMIKFIAIGEAGGILSHIATKYLRILVE
jgi:hypothetical protein